MRSAPNAVISVAYYPDGRQENLLAAASENADVNHYHAMAYDQCDAASRRVSTIPTIFLFRGHSDRDRDAPRRHGKHHSTFVLREQESWPELPRPTPAPSKCTLGLPFYGRHADGSTSRTRFF